MARAIVAIETKDLDGSLVLFHRILELLSEIYENEEITKIEYEGKRAHVFSEMGNVYILREELETASKLIVGTMRSCLEAGIQPSHPMMVELSLKLALIYEKQKRVEESEIGFRFCIDNCLIEAERRDLEESEKENVTALLGMCYNYYSKFLYKTGKYSSALEMAFKSIDLALKIYDKTHPNVVNLINDQGVCYLALGDFKKSLNKFQEAIDICLECPQEELMSILPFIYANIGHLYIKMGDVDKGEEMCVNSEKYWKSCYKQKSIENIELQGYVRDCFMRLAGLKSEQREE